MPAAKIGPLTLPVASWRRRLRQCRRRPQRDASYSINDKYEFPQQREEAALLQPTLVTCSPYPNRPVTHQTNALPTNVHSPTTQIHPPIVRYSHTRQPTPTRLLAVATKTDPASVESFTIRYTDNPVSLVAMEPQV